MTDVAATLRRCLLLLAALGVVGTAAELALIRHWNGFIQLIPWFSLAVLAVAIVLVMARRQVRVARVLAVLVTVSAVFGIYEHVLANYEAGPLDFRYSARWATMSMSSKVWAAVSESVGPAPNFAPLILAWSALCLLFATIRFGTDGRPARAGDRWDGRRRDGDRSPLAGGRAERSGAGSV